MPPCRIGTAEVESALVAHPQCAEAAVVGYEHPIKGQGIYAYVTLMEGIEPTEDIRRELIQTVRGIIGAFAAPDVIHWVSPCDRTVQCKGFDCAGAVEELFNRWRVWGGERALQHNVAVCSLSKSELLG